MGWKNRPGIPVILPGIGYMPAIFVSVAAYRPGFPNQRTCVGLWWDVQSPVFSACSACRGQVSKQLLTKLFVLCKGGSFQNFHFHRIHFVIEKRMPDVLEMGSDLVGAAGFQNTFHYVHVTQAFQYPVVRYGMFAVTAVRETGHDFAVGQVTSDMSGDGTRITFQVSPANGNVFPVGGFMEKLGCQMGLGMFRLAITSKPEVSLSIRCTKPGRGSLLSLKSGFPFKCQAQGFTKFRCNVHRKRDHHSCRLLTTIKCFVLSRQY